jgi:hypothetical protein
MHRIDGNANAEADIETLTLQYKGKAQGLSHLFGSQGSSRLVGARQDHREFVSTEARHGIGFPHDMPEANRGLTQDQVSRMITKGVVDLFETIEVENKQGDRAVCVMCTADRLLQAVHKKPAIGQIGQSIIDSTVLERVLCLLPVDKLAYLPANGGRCFGKIGLWISRLHAEKLDHSVYRFGTFDGKTECAVQLLLRGHQSSGEATGRHNIVDPFGLSAVPDSSRQSVTGQERDLAAEVRELRNRDPGRMPDIRAPQSILTLVDAPIHSHVPLSGIADSLQALPDGFVNARRLG